MLNVQLQIKIVIGIFLALTVFEIIVFVKWLFEQLENWDSYLELDKILFFHRIIWRILLVLSGAFGYIGAQYKQRYWIIPFMICLCLLIAIFIIRFLVVYLYEPGCLDFEEDYGILRDLDLSDSMDISDNCIFRKVVTTAVYMIPFGLSWYFLIFVPCNWSKLKFDSIAIPQEELKDIGTL